MRVAQDLYEGIELGDEGAVGLITYMRTDSTRVAESAAGTARDYLKTLFGAEYLADGIQLYGDSKKKNTQDAHEAIRPTDPTRRPDELKKYLSPDQFKLYQLVWQRFMASQMAPAVFDTTTLDFDIAVGPQPDIGRHSYLFRATGSVATVERENIDRRERYPSRYRARTCAREPARFRLGERLAPGRILRRSRQRRVPRRQGDGPGPRPARLPARRAAGYRSIRARRRAVAGAPL